MAGPKKSKNKDQMKKGRMGKKKVIDKLIEASKNFKKSNTSSDDSPCTKSRTSTNASTSFSETVTPLAPSPQKVKPIINLTPSNTSHVTCHLPAERTSSRFLWQMGHPQKQPKAVVPGLLQDSRCREPNFLIIDRRHENGDLIRLPKEPDVKRNSSFIRTGVFHYFGLPAELRNQICDYLIEPECYALGWVDQTRKSKLLTYRLPQRSQACQPRMSEDTLCRRRSLTKNPRTADRQQLMNDQYRHHSPVALLWVCKKMYQETSSIFYSKSTFCFSLLGTLRQFINTLNTDTKKSITKLKLTHKAYGHPAKTEHHIWKMKADRAWEDLCWRVSSEFKSLSYLTLDLNYGHSKLQFVPFFEASHQKFGTAWMIALWAFDASDLRRCACQIRSDTTLDTILEVESHKIRRELLGDEWDQDVERHRDAFGFGRLPAKSRPKKAAILQITQTGEVFGLA